MSYSKEKNPKNKKLQLIQKEIRRYFKHISLINKPQLHL